LSFREFSFLLISCTESFIYNVPVLNYVSWKEAVIRFILCCCTVWR